MRIFVVNTGIASPLGLNTKDNLEALISMRHGLHEVSGVIDEKLNSLPIGRVPISNAELQKAIGISEELPRTSLLSLYAAKQALEGYNMEGLRLGFFSGTTVGGMDKSEDFFKEYVPASGQQQIRDIIHHTCGSASAVVAKYLPKLDYISTINTACSSSLNTIIAAAKKIRQGSLDVALAGGSDALCRFTLNGFNSLMILDTQLCRPFDENRNGLNLGEGAGYLLLVSETVLKKHNLTPICELVGYGNSNDAFHATALSDDGEGPFLSMTKAIAKANINCNDIDYINLHGTGTSNNDQSEAKAIKRIFGDNIPSLSSTKSYTGHPLGASGGIESVFCALAIREQVVYPNLRFETPMNDSQIIPQLKAEHKKINYVLSNSFGFGGNCSSIILKNVD